MPNVTKTAVTWIEVILVLLLAAMGMGIWAATAKLVERSLAEREPKKEAFEDRHRIKAIQRMQALSEEEWKATVSLRIQQHLEIERQISHIETLERTFSGLRSLTPPANSIPAGVWEAYNEARQRKLEAALLEQRLDARLQDLRARLARTEKALRDARSAVSRDLECARILLTRKRRIWTAALRVAGLAALLLSTFILSSSPTVRRAGARRRPILAGTALVLVILCLYDLLGAAFAGAFGGLLVFIALWTLLRSIPEGTSNGR